MISPIFYVQCKYYNVYIFRICLQCSNSTSHSSSLLKSYFIAIQVKLFGNEIVWYKEWKFGFNFTKIYNLKLVVILLLTFSFITIHLYHPFIILCTGYDWHWLEWEDLRNTAAYLVAQQITSQVCDCTRFSLHGLTTCIGKVWGEFHIS